MPEGAAARLFAHDLWAPLNHIIGDGIQPVLRGGAVPTWADQDDARRLLAYRALAGYLDNVRRYWLPGHMWESGIEMLEHGRPGRPVPPAAASYREYGHAASLVAAARSTILGEHITIRVEGTTEGGTALPDRAQAWVDDWATTERLAAKILAGEENTIGLGDHAYALTWSDTARRPRLRSYDPGMYFPDWDALEDPYYVAAGWDDEDYPPVVHFAWEHVDPASVCWVHRATYRMLKRDQPITYPYGQASPWECEFSRARWRTQMLKGTDTIHTLDPARFGGETLQTPTPLGIDFLPVVHVPNDYPGGRLWGRSLLLRIAQVLDDLAGADTDLAVDAELVASPPVVTQGGAGGGSLQTGPGAWWDLQAGSSAGYIDTSRTLDALLKQAGRLEDVLARNSRLGQLMLGMVRVDQVPSGYAMRLGYAAAESLAREMHQVREQKYPLLAKMAVRMAQVTGALPAGDTPTVCMDLGSGLVVDRAATIEEAKDLLDAGAISTETAVRMLRAVGVPSGDAHEEVARIRADHPEQAVQVVDAVGDVPAARDRLGLPPAEPTPALVPSPAPVPAPAQVPPVAQ